jgi:hypothetical protein
VIIIGSDFVEVAELYTYTIPSEEDRESPRGSGHRCVVRALEPITVRVPGKPNCARNARCTGQGTGALIGPDREQPLAQASD